VRCRTTAITVGPLRNARAGIGQPSRPVAAPRWLVVPRRPSDLLGTLSSQPVPPEATPTAWWGPHALTPNCPVCSFSPRSLPKHRKRARTLRPLPTPELHLICSPGFAYRRPSAQKRAGLELLAWVGPAALVHADLAAFEACEGAPRRGGRLCPGTRPGGTLLTSAFPLEAKPIGLLLAEKPDGLPP